MRLATWISLALLVFAILPDLSFKAGFSLAFISQIIDGVAMVGGRTNTCSVAALAAIVAAAVISTRASGSPTMGISFGIMLLPLPVIGSLAFWFRAAKHNRSKSAG